MIAKFRNETTASRYSDRLEIANAIILGDDGKYWVVTLAKMESLIGQGYEAI